jgi:hypothetical protein
MGSINYNGLLPADRPGGAFLKTLDLSIMRNLNLSLPLADGGRHPLDFESGRELIQELLGDDWGAPPRCLQIEAKAQDGRTVIISIPYSDSDEVSVKIEEKDQG